MMLRRRWLLPALAAAVMFSVSCGPSQQPVPRLEIEEGEFTSAKKCAACHKDIHAAWQSSLHARSAVDPVFRESFEESLELTGGKTRELCLSCHAPTAILTGDYELNRELTLEGVNCDFCHSLTGTNLENRDNPFLLKVGPVKFGPVSDAASNGHDVGYSEFHTSSLFCAGCHEYVNPHEVALLTTYSEWEQYQQQGGEKTCQECHMPLVMANIVDPKVKRIAGAFVNLHRTPGGHSLDQLNRSVRLRIVEVAKERETLAVTVSVRNGGAGHMVPTGTPTRKVILSTEVRTDDGKLLSEERLYQKVVEDANGKEIRKDSRLFTEAVNIRSDSRVAPGEERLETFSFQVPADQNLEIIATLIYLYSPHDRLETQTRTEFASDSRKLTARWKR